MFPGVAVLLVARAQLRLASAEEAAAAEDVQNQAHETAENMDQEEDTKAKAYVDLTKFEVPPEEKVEPSVPKVKSPKVLLEIQ